MPGIFEALKRARANRRPSAEQQIYGEIPVEQERGGRLDKQSAGSRQAYLDTIGGGQESLDEYTRGAISRGMPAFEGGLQSIRETAERRGIGGGGNLATSYEGDLASAFHQNIADATAGQAMSLYGTQLSARGNVYGMDVDQAESSRNRYLDLLTGQRDFEMAKENARRKRRGGVFGALGAVAGGIGGFFLGGPAGAYAGAQIGGSAGSGLGG